MIYRLLLLLLWLMKFGDGLLVGFFLLEGEAVVVHLKELLDVLPEIFIALVIHKLANGRHDRISLLRNISISIIRANLNKLPSPIQKQPLQKYHK